MSEREGGTPGHDIDGDADDGTGDRTGDGPVGGARRGSPEAFATDPSRARLAEESGVLPWSELVRHFARGVVVRVGADIDLIDAAICLIEDDEARLQRWIDDGRIARASDDDARDWTAREPEFLCVVTAPWVLVQERRSAG